jgi:IS5 family transposase
LVVKAGHDLIQQREEEVVLKGRCDSFVVETDVHYPTDINLLLDAIRKIIFLIGNLCGELYITEWRQYRHIFKKIKKQFNPTTIVNYAQKLPVGVFVDVTGRPDDSGFEPR